MVTLFPWAHLLVQYLCAWTTLDHCTSAPSCSPASSPLPKTISLWSSSWIFYLLLLCHTQRRTDFHVFPVWNTSIWILWVCGDGMWKLPNGRQQAVVVRTALPFKRFPISDFKNCRVVYYLLKEKLRWMITFSFGFWIRDKILWDSFMPCIDPSHFWSIFIFIFFLFLTPRLPAFEDGFFCYCCFFLSYVLF